MKNHIITFAIFMLWIIIGLFLSFAFAEVPPPPDCPEISLNISHAGDNSTIGLTAGTPFAKDKVDGYIAFSGQHVHNGVQGTDVATRVVYAEAGLKVLQKLEFNVYGKALRNSERDLDRQLDGGYFLELHAYDFPKRKLSAGFGNFARHEITELSEDAQATFNWSLFVRKQRGAFTAQYTLTSQSDFSDWEHTLAPSWDFQVKDNFALTINLLLIHADEMTHTSSQIGATYKF